jgi:hypothetical protein
MAISENPNLVAIRRCSQKITPYILRHRHVTAKQPFAGDGAARSFPHPTALPHRVMTARMPRRNFSLAPCLAYNFEFSEVANAG